MRRGICLLCGVLALGSIALLPAAAQGRGTSTIRYKVLRASASATLMFERTYPNPLSKDTGRGSLLVKLKGRGTGSLGTRTGRVLFPVKGQRYERVRLRRPGTINTYLVTTCKQTTPLKSRGGATLLRQGRRVRVRWAFPQVRLRFCPGPRVTSTLTRKMKRTYPAAVFEKSRPVLFLKGSAALKTSTVQGTYRWTATVVLKRLS